MIPRPFYVLPAQRAIVERGSAAGLPASGAVITSQWFDVYQVHKGGIIVPQTGAIVSAGSETLRGVGSTLRVGAYYLDVFCQHANALGLPLTIEIETSPADALAAAADVGVDSWTMVVQAQELVTGRVAPATRRFPIAARFVRLNLTYPTSDATRFHLAAVLRGV